MCVCVCVCTCVCLCIIPCVRMCCFVMYVHICTYVHVHYMYVLYVPPVLYRFLHTLETTASESGKLTPKQDIGVAHFQFLVFLFHHFTLEAKTSLIHRAITAVIRVAQTLRYSIHSLHCAAMYCNYVSTCVPTYIRTCYVHTFMYSMYIYVMFVCTYTCVCVHAHTHA